MLITLASIFGKILIFVSTLHKDGGYLNLFTLEKIYIYKKKM